MLLIFMLCLRLCLKHILSRFLPAFGAHMEAQPAKFSS